MELVNATPVPAKLMVARLIGAEHRIGLIVAKATFMLTPGGARLETQDPVPIFDEDQETDLGILPRDDLPRRDPAFEVMLLGAAYASGGRAVDQARVSLAVGGERRELAIFGDRVWEGPRDQRGSDAPHISSPAPFVRMPLTYTRAFGGTAEVEVDREAFLEVTDARNRRGRGFDPAPAARALGESLCAPEGYPRFDAARPLPNVEDPAALITAWDDAPAPAGWGALPMDSSLHAERTIKLTGDGAVPGELPFSIEDGAFHRAHPTWVIGLPPRESVIEMKGLRPESSVFSFRLPAVRVLVDYVAGIRSGTRELAPHALVLLPEERRFYLLFRHAFSFEYTGTERGMRLRVEPGGWYSPEEA